MTWVHCIFITSLCVPDITDNTGLSRRLQSERQLKHGPEYCVTMTHSLSLDTGVLPIGVLHKRATTRGRAGSLHETMDNYWLEHGAVCRCMDSGSSNFKVDEHDPEAVLGHGLGRAKGVLIDAGLHSMYVHAIRRAKHFIYIENQFFTGLGSRCIGIMLFCTTNELLYCVQS